MNTPPEPQPTSINRLDPPIPPPGAPHVQYQTPGYPTYPYTPYPYPAVPRPPKQSLGQRLAVAAENGLLGRMLAGVGVAVTLAGIVMLLVLAAQAGLLRPEVRVAGGGVLAAVLAGLGVWIGRAPARRPGAVALVATGIAAGLFDVLATSTVYHWLPVPAALGLSAVIAGAGLAVAHRWDSQTLGLMVSVPMLVLAAVITGGPDETLVAFAVVYAAATVWIQVGRDWTPVYVVNTVAVALPGCGYAVDAAQPWSATILALAAVAVTVGSAVLLIRSTSQPALLALVSGVGALPLVIAVHDLGTPAAGMLAAGAAVFAAAAFGTVRSTDREVRIIWLVEASLMLLLATGYLVDTAYQPSTLLAAAVVLAVASRVAHDLADTVRVMASVFGVIGVALLNVYGAAASVFWPTVDDHSTAASLAVGAGLGLIATVLTCWSWIDARPEQALGFTVAGSAVSLWLLTTGCMAVAHLIAPDSAFRAGHAATTVVWGVIAAAALVIARRRTGNEAVVALTAGLSLMAAAIGKLFVFDLSALDGVYRVLAFILVGLMLLGLGVAYAQNLTTSDDDEHSAPAA